MGWAQGGRAPEPLCFGLRCPGGVAALWMGCAHLSVTAKEGQVYSKRRQQGAAQEKSPACGLSDSWPQYVTDDSPRCAPTPLSHSSFQIGVFHIFVAHVTRRRTQTWYMGLIKQDLLSLSVTFCSFLCCTGPSPSFMYSFYIYENRSKGYVKDVLRICTFIVVFMSSMLSIYQYKRIINQAKFYTPDL